MKINFKNQECIHPLTMLLLSHVKKLAHHDQRDAILPNIVGLGWNGHGGVVGEGEDWESHRWHIKCQTACNIMHRNFGIHPYLYSWKTHLRCVGLVRKVGIGLVWISTNFKILRWLFKNTHNDFFWSYQWQSRAIANKFVQTWVVARGVQPVAFYGTGSPASLWNYGTGLPDARLPCFTYYR